MKKPRLVPSPPGPSFRPLSRPAKLISVVSCAATTRRPRQACAVRWAASSVIACGVACSDPRKRWVAISPARSPPNLRTTSVPEPAMSSRIRSNRRETRISPQKPAPINAPENRTGVESEALIIRQSKTTRLCERRSPQGGRIKEGGRAALSDKRAAAQAIASLARTTPHPCPPPHRASVRTPVSRRAMGGGCANPIDSIEMQKALGAAEVKGVISNRLPRLEPRQDGWRACGRSGPASVAKRNGFKDDVGSPKKPIDCEDQTGFVVVSDTTGERIDPSQDRRSLGRNI
jgi:hypothetical protein